MGVGHGIGRGGGIKFEGTEFTGFTAEKDLKKGAICSASYTYENKQNISLPLPLSSISKDKGWRVFKVSDTLILVSENLKYSTSKLALMQYNPTSRQFSIIDTMDFPYNINITMRSNTKYIVVSDNPPYGIKGIYELSIINNRLTRSALFNPTVMYGSKISEIYISFFSEDVAICGFLWGVYHDDGDGGYYSSAYSIAKIDLIDLTITDIKVTGVTFDTQYCIHPVDIFFPNKKVVRTKEGKYVTITCNPSNRTFSTEVTAAPFCGQLIPAKLNPLDNRNYFLSADKSSLVLYSGGMSYEVYRKENGLISMLTIEIMGEEELKKTPWGSENKIGIQCKFYITGGIAYADTLMENTQYSNSSSATQGVMQVIIGFNTTTLQPIFNEKGTESEIQGRNRNVGLDSVLLFNNSEVVAIVVNTAIADSEYTFKSACSFTKNLKITDTAKYFETQTPSLLWSKAVHRQADIMVLQDIKAGQTGKAILLN